MCLLQAEGLLLFPFAAPLRRLSNSLLCAIVGNTQNCAQTTVCAILERFACRLCADLRANDGFVTFLRRSPRRSECLARGLDCLKSRGTASGARLDTRVRLAPWSPPFTIQVVIPAVSGLTGKRGTQVSGIRDASKRSGPNVFWHLFDRRLREIPLWPPKPTSLAFAGMQTTRQCPRPRTKRYAEGAWRGPLQLAASRWGTGPKRRDQYAPCKRQDQKEWPKSM